LTPQNTGEDYLPIHRVSIPPKFDEQAISRATVYPPIALRSGIEGRVILELFIDRTGQVQRITILQETPPGRGFGEAAVRAFEGQRCSPAEANGLPVSVRYRYPVSFRIR
ncbi:MAG: energy transducer TonB, partial [Treponema sp.]|nr:energy transducer TonB [Treponema sp.]